MSTVTPTTNNPSATTAPATPPFSIRTRGAIVVGADNKLGKALVQALLDEGAAKVYVTAQDAASLSHYDGNEQVVPISVDLSDSLSISNNLALIKDVSVVINNAALYAAKPQKEDGYSNQGGILSTNLERAQLEMQANYLAPLQVAQAFQDVLRDPRRSALVNICDISSWLNLPLVPGGSTFSCAKAAAHSMTQALRRELRDTCLVVGVYPGALNTEKVKAFDASPTSAEEAAYAITHALTQGQEYVFPDELSQQIIKGFSRDSHHLEDKMNEEYIDKLLVIAQDAAAKNHLDAHSQ